MSRQKDKEPKQKHILLLYQGDFERLGSFFPEVGATVTIRRLVREYLLKLEAGLTPLEKPKNGSQL